MIHRHSITRITGWSAFLAFALLFGLAITYLPTLLNLDAYRPTVTDLLEKNFHCQAEIGHVRGQLFPSPGLSVTRMALLEPTGEHRVLASGSLRLTLSWKTLLKGRIQFESLRFMRPRILAHRDTDYQGKTHWTVLSLPHAENSADAPPVGSITLRNGSLEVWDHRTQPAARWIINQITGDYQMTTGQAAFTATAPFLGRHNRLDIRYQRAEEFPLDVYATEISLAALAPMLNVSSATFQGSAEASIKARFDPQLDIRATLSPLKLDRQPGTRWVGTVSFTDHHLRTQLKTIVSPPMTITLEADFPRDTWSVKGQITGYNSVLVKPFYDQTWMNRLAGGGTLTFSAASGAAYAPAAWSWSAGGHGFKLAGSDFTLPEWSAQGTARKMVIYVRAATAQGGAGEVVWEQTLDSKDPQLTVSVVSVTVHQLLHIFHMDAKLETIPATGWNPYGYEMWTVTRADMESVIRSAGTLDIQDSDIDLAGMHIDLAGTFGLTSSAPQAHIHGGIYTIPLADRIHDFSRTDSPLTGMAQFGYDVSFPLNTAWLRGLNGTLQINAVNGVLKELKTVYRVMSVLNLSNYFRFRMPQVTAEGVAYQTLNGNITFKDGLATTEDLFLRSPNLNIGMTGAADLLMKRIDTTLRLELFRFLEDVLKNVPITHWIFKKPNKIFLPLVVHVKGPWNDPDVF